jgi:hypothetical protein
MARRRPRDRSPTGLLGPCIRRPHRPWEAAFWGSGALSGSPLSADCEAEVLRDSWGHVFVVHISPWLPCAPVFFFQRSCKSQTGWEAGFWGSPHWQANSPSDNLILTWPAADCEAEVLQGSWGHVFVVPISHCLSASCPQLLRVFSPPRPPPEAKKPLRVYRPPASRTLGGRRSSGGGVPSLEACRRPARLQAASLWPAADCEAQVLQGVRGHVFVVHVTPCLSASCPKLLRGVCPADAKITLWGLPCAPVLFFPHVRLLQVAGWVGGGLWAGVPPLKCSRKPTQAASF